MRASARACVALAGAVFLVAAKRAHADDGLTAHGGLGLQRTTGSGAGTEAGNEALVLGAGYVFGRLFELEADLGLGRTRLDAGAAVDETWGWRWLAALRPGIRLGPEDGPMLVLGPALTVSVESINARVGDTTTRTTDRTLALGAGGGLRLPIAEGLSAGPDLLYGHAILRHTCIVSGGFERCDTEDVHRGLFTATLTLRAGF